jgi:hypothetical protein
MKILRSLGLFLLAALAAVSASAADAGPRAAGSGTPAGIFDDVTVLSADAGSLLIEYTPRYGAPRTVRSGAAEFLQVPFDASVLTAPPGTPDIRFRFFSFAVPTEAGATARVVAADYTDIPGAALAPVPRVRMVDGLPENEVFEYDLQAAPAADWQPASVAEITDAGTARSLTIAGIRIYPVRYNASSRTIRRYTRIRVEIQFGASNGPRTTEADLRLLGPALLNPQAARFWTQSVRKSAAAVPSVLATGAWIRLTVNAEGVYRLDNQYLQSIGVPVSGLDPRTIRVFGGGGRELPEDPLALRPADLQEIAIGVEGEDDGRFDAGDYVLFYGRSTRGWRYDPAGRTIRHTIHRYSDENYYWLTYGGAAGKRMAALRSESDPASVIAETTLDGVFVEEEKVNILRSGKDWLGQSFSGTGASFTYVNALPGLVAGSPVTYRYTLGSTATRSATFTVRESGQILGTHALPPANPDAYTYVATSSFQVATTPSISGAQSQLNFSYSTPSDPGGVGYADWLEVLYPRMLWAVDGYLQFRAPDSTGIVEYRLQQFASEPVILDVTDHANVRRVRGVTGSYVFQVRETAGQGAVYCAATPQGWKTPVGAQTMPNQDLRGVADGADLIIVTSGEFRAAADRLKGFREQPAHGGLKVIVADVAQIYNEFSSGVKDVSAIRDYLKYAYDTWTLKPTFVLFLGWASYDYKGLLGSKSSYVPTWQSAQSTNDVASYSTDDFFVKFGRNDLISLVNGRLSARTTAEANALVDRIIRYETASGQDPWKQRILFVGDDAWTPERGEVGDGVIHSEDTERLATRFTPDEFEKIKVYLADYPTVTTAAGRRKPGAYQAIIDQVNRGVLVVSWAGHGNPGVWAHERVLETGTSIPAMVNGDRMSLFFLATCNFSQFDDPKSYTGGELLMNREGGGAVAVISACRKVYAGSNATLAQGTFREMFGRDIFGRVAVERPATALFLYKNGIGNLANDQKYIVLGDPAMRLQYPVRYAAVDSVNGEPVDSLGGVPRTSLIQLKSLSRVTVKGSMRDGLNQFDPTFSGKVTLVVNDATSVKTIINFYPGRNWNYLETGSTIFRGEHSVTDGRFSATFVVPKDVAYADSNAAARILGYVAAPGVDGSAYTGKIRIGGTDTTAAPDLQGPTVELFLENRSFRPGDLVSPNPTLIVDLRDSSGINTSGSGIGHRIEAWVNSSNQSIDITERYASTLDNYREGSVQYPLAGLAPGRNVLRVRAWDSYNNSSMTETYFTVANVEGLTITDVFNYPNPFGRETEFTFRHNQPVALSVAVKIYTVAGRLIHSLETVTGGDLFVRIPWDGRDRDGDEVANGVYLYKVVARTLDGKYSSEALGKLAKVR